jgi:hypothetical protein
VILLAVLLVLLTGCRSNSPLSDEEAVRRAQACIGAEASVSFLPAARPDIHNCLDKAMREPSGRRFLLDHANQAVASWSSDMARFVSEDLGRDPSKSLTRALAGLGAVPQVGGTGRRIGTFYEQLVTAAFANVEDRRTAAAEVAGTMNSFVAQGPGKQVDHFIEDARERLPHGDRREVTLALSEMISRAMGELVAVAFWANERVRSRLLAGDHPLPPVVAPPATTPPLEDPPGKLLIPSPDQQPAHTAFLDWYERGGGEPLANAARFAIEKSGIPEWFLE